MRIGANSFVFLQPTTRAYTARTSAGLSRLTEPMVYIITSHQDRGAYSVIQQKI